jgi:hypothetical protein
VGSEKLLFMELYLCYNKMVNNLKAVEENYVRREKNLPYDETGSS